MIVLLCVSAWLDSYDIVDFCQIIEKNTIRIVENGYFMCYNTPI